MSIMAMAWAGVKPVSERRQVQHLHGQLFLSLLETFWVTGIGDKINGGLKRSTGVQVIIRGIPDEAEEDDSAAISSEQPKPSPTAMVKQELPKLEAGKVV